MKSWLDESYAMGGGDVPEAVADALHDVLKLNWRPEATKICILIADAPPHGLIQGWDAFPHGCPDGLDPVVIINKMAEKNITLYSVGCEPAILQSRDFFMALAHITGGQYVSLRNAKLLAKVVIGGVQEEITLQRLMEQVHEEVINNMQAQNGTGYIDEDLLAANVHRRLAAQGAQTTALFGNNAVLKGASTFAQTMAAKGTTFGSWKDEWDKNAPAESCSFQFGFARSTGLFGHTAPSPGGGDLMGSTAPAGDASVGPATLGSGFSFGTGPSHGFGSLTGSSIVFQSTAPGPAGGGLFGSSAPPGDASSGLFGSTAPGTAGGGLFGSTAPPGDVSSGLFGSAASSPARGGLFGGTAPGSTGGGLFGSSAPPGDISSGSATFGSGFSFGTGAPVTLEGDGRTGTVFGFSLGGSGTPMTNVSANALSEGGLKFGTTGIQANSPAGGPLVNDTRRTGFTLGANLSGPSVFGSGTPAPAPGSGFSFGTLTGGGLFAGGFGSSAPTATPTKGLTFGQNVLGSDHTNSSGPVSGSGFSSGNAGAPSAPTSTGGGLFAGGFGSSAPTATPTTGFAFGSSAPSYGTEESKTIPTGFGFSSSSTPFGAFSSGPSGVAEMADMDYSIVKTDINLEQAKRMVKKSIAMNKS